MANDATLLTRAGDANRLIYAVDSRGLLCGTNNSFRNSSIDLTGSPNLYYLNALDLLSPTNMLYAKTVCVSSCPGAEDACDIGDLPCTNNSQYRCAPGRTRARVLACSSSADAAACDSAAACSCTQVPLLPPGGAGPVGQHVGRRITC